jgi:hypothetical protein
MTGLRKRLTRLEEPTMPADIQHVITVRYLNPGHGVR